MVADFLLNWGWILRNLNVKAGARVLKYGAGEVQLSIHLARMGCDVAIVDIEPGYLTAVRKQCTSLRLTIELQQGQFGDSVRDRRFDRIIFFEAFHHAWIIELCLRS
ncbi:MAG: methyltransferase domain-containing protein [Lacunisphaera sp.]